MTNEKLRYILKQVELDECNEVITNYIYYIKREIKQRCNNGDGSFRYVVDEYEFIIIAENGKKQAIILNCGNIDLHWFVLKEWRRKHILSNALRSFDIKKIWPDIKQITCSYSYNDEYEYDQKCEMTKHLASIAGVKYKEK